MTTPSRSPEPDATPRQALHQAVMADHPDEVADLVAADPALAAGGHESSPLLVAIYRGRHEVIATLLAADPALTLFEAAALGVTDRVRELCTEDPPSVRAYTADGFSALHLASFFGRTETVRALLDAGANVSGITQTDDETTPLHAAAGALHPVTCQMLIDRGAPVNAQQALGFTPLHLAARYGDEELARLLVAAGADPTIESDHGKTAGDLAYEFEHDTLAAFLGRQRR